MAEVSQEDAEQIKEIEELLVEKPVEETREMYNNIAVDYDGKLEKAQVIPLFDVNAKAIADLGIPKNAKILDVCAGTGLLGVSLNKIGYTNLDAMDISEKMLEVAKSKNVYDKMIVSALSVGVTLPIEDDTYDLVIMLGAFCPGHVYIDSFTELIRIAKKGGYVCWTYWDLNSMVKFSEKYKPETIEEYIQNFIKEGKWRRVKPAISMGVHYSYFGETFMEIMEKL